MASNPDVPPFTGYVETTFHALRLIYAARQGVIPRITRRLNDSERRTMIKSGAVFIFSVEESGIKRWTDGLLWSPSRIVRNFLVYREINERTSSRGSHKKVYPDPQLHSLTTRRSSPDHNLVAFKGPGHLTQSPGPGDQGTFKLNGLIKKTITVTIDGSDLHLISYYTSEDVRSGRLKRPTSRPDIMALSMPLDIFNETNFRVPLKVEIGPDGKPRLVCEAEESESPVECKVEEPMYHASVPAQWAVEPDGIRHPPQVDTSFATSTLYHENHHHNQSSPALYSRPNTGDKWSPSLENVRVAPLGRPDINHSWSSSPSQTHSHVMPRRREGIQTPQTNSWPTLNSQPARWRPDSYTSSAGDSGHRERSRVRLNTGYENSSMGANRRESENTSVFVLHSDIGVGGREDGVQRLPWLSREVPSSDRYFRSSQVGTSFPTTTPASPFAQHHGYPRAPHPYATWPPNDDNSTTNASIHSIPVSSYETSYMSLEP